jgi:hypothetical protein
MLLDKGVTSEGITWVTLQLPDFSAYRKQPGFTEIRLTRRRISFDTTINPPKLVPLRSKVILKATDDSMDNLPFTDDEMIAGVYWYIAQVLFVTPNKNPKKPPKSKLKKVAEAAVLVAL